MQEVDWLQVVFRWMHIGSVIVLVGGAFFMRFVLMPSAKELPDEAHATLRGRVLGRWKKLVGILIGLILISGFYNLIKTVKTVDTLWHMLIGVKILLALAVFFIASALVGSSKGLQPIRDKMPLWLALNIALATTIVLISGLLRYLPRKPATELAGQPSSAVVRPVAMSNSLTNGTNSAITANR